jgi:hypothetical protein
MLKFMNSRQKGYVLLDTNLEEVQSAISRMLSIRLNDSKWKMIVKTAYMVPAMMPLGSI